MIEIKYKSKKPKQNITFKIIFRTKRYKIRSLFLIRKRQKRY